MGKAFAELKRKDWSVNLEDEYYVIHPEELMNEAIQAVKQTGAGCYVNLVTPGDLGHPENWLIDSLVMGLEKEAVAFQSVQYIDECGCGGFVTRVFR